MSIRLDDFFGKGGYMTEEEKQKRKTELLKEIVSEIQQLEVIELDPSTD